MQAMVSRRDRSTAGRVNHDRCTLIDTKAGRIDRQRCGTVGHVTSATRQLSTRGKLGAKGSLYSGALVSRGKHAIPTLRTGAQAMTLTANRQVPGYCNS